MLRDGGTLVFKWNEYQIPQAEVLALAIYRPLFGSTSARNLNTHWFVFAKVPNHEFHLTAALVELPGLWDELGAAAGEPKR